MAYEEDEDEDDDDAGEEEDDAQGNGDGRVALYPYSMSKEGPSRRDPFPHVCEAW